jgi:hypothetical protein
MTGRGKKEGKHFPQKHKLVSEPEGNKRKQIPRSRLQENEQKLCQRTQ